MNAKLLFAALAIAPFFAMAQQPPTRVADGVLTDGNGMTLYTSDLDAPGTSRCLGDCAREWPPLAAPANAKPWAEYTAFARPDGSQQWAYRGRPLYLHARDKAAGDRNGDGAGNAWRIARP